MTKTKRKFGALQLMELCAVKPKMQVLWEKCRADGRELIFDFLFRFQQFFICAHRIQKWILLRHGPVAVSILGNVRHRQILPGILWHWLNEILYPRIYVHRTID